MENKVFIMEEEEEDPYYSVIEYMRDHSGYRCGYCKSSDSNYSTGMWAHRMAVGDYQALIDRGWRRSGKYCYKPMMDRMCCPSYTIRCDALEFNLSKSQKKVLKRMHHFLSHGSTKAFSNDGEGKPESVTESLETSSREHFRNIEDKAEPSEDFDSVGKSLSKLKGIKRMTTELSSSHSESTYKPEEQNNKYVSGPDPSKPVCKKAKFLRRERYKAKKANLKDASVNNKKLNKPKTIEDYLNEPLPDNPAHKLEIRLVQSQPQGTEYKKTFATSHQIYQKYQVSVHRDLIEKCTIRRFERFLCVSPLQNWKPNHGPEKGYGSFHQQYWLDDRLIAVGVIDILPTCISSVYFYYDPEFSFLSLGTYASLREIAFTRELCNYAPSIRWYYMGYYIHSCPKMRYKGAYNPSSLLCPETYMWQPIHRCIHKLDASKYSRLNDDPNAEDKDGDIDVNKVLCLCRGCPIPYGMYRQTKESEDSDEDEQTLEYAKLAGKISYSMLLYKY